MSGASNTHKEDDMSTTNQSLSRVENVQDESLTDCSELFSGEVQTETSTDGSDLTDGESTQDGSEFSLPKYGEKRTDISWTPLSVLRGSETPEWGTQTVLRVCGVKALRNGIRTADEFAISKSPAVRRLEFSDDLVDQGNCTWESDISDKSMALSVEWDVRSPTTS